MIYEDDSKQFSLMMKVTWQSYGRNGVDRETLRYWFDKLIKHEFVQVSKAFDEWIKAQKDLPTVSDILKLCQHKVTIHARLPSPLAAESNKRHADEVVAFVSEKTKKNKGNDWVEFWEKKLKNPKGVPDVAIKAAKSALINLGKPRRIEENI